MKSKIEEMIEAAESALEYIEMCEDYHEPAKDLHSYWDLKNSVEDMKKPADHYLPERIPPNEVGEIICCMVEHGLADDEQTEELRERILAGPSVKFSNYMPDCPGWIGDLYFIVWGWHNRTTYLGRAAHSREWQIVYDGELYKEFNRPTEKVEPPPEEIKKAEERLRKLDALADKCAWHKFQTQITQDQRIARGFWTAIMEEQTAWETKWKM